MRIGIGSDTYCNVYDYEEGFKKMKSHGYDCVDYKVITNINSDLYKLSEEEFFLFGLLEWVEPPELRSMT